MEAVPRLAGCEHNVDLAACGCDILGESHTPEAAEQAGFGSRTIVDPDVVTDEPGVEPREVNDKPLANRGRDLPHLELIGPVLAWKR